jgi:RNase P subunit RPR2
MHIYVVSEISTKGGMDMAAIRCKKCGGFLFDSTYSYRFTREYKGMKHCFNCGRDWRLERIGRRYVITQYPVREGEYA